MSDTTVTINEIVNDVTVTPDGDSIAVDVSVVEQPIQVTVATETLTEVPPDPATVWTNLVYGFTKNTPPVLNASQPVSGEVYDYVYAATGGGTTTRYRLITSSEDSFYTGWDGANATGLIATRELTI